MALREKRLYLQFFWSVFFRIWTEYGERLICIFPHLDWIPISFRLQPECGKMRTRKTPNTDFFHAGWVFLPNNYSCCFWWKLLEKGCEVPLWKLSFLSNYEVFDKIMRTPVGNDLALSVSYFFSFSFFLSCNSFFRKLTDFHISSFHSAAFVIFSSIIYNFF